MSNYIVNHMVEDFDTVDITEKRLQNRNNTVVVVLDSSVDVEASKYYSTIKELLISGARVIEITTDANEYVSRTIRMLMTVYNAYDMYNAVSKNIISIDYLNRIMDRQPDIGEIAQYIGGDISAYDELSSLMFCISGFVKSGDIEGLKKYIEENLKSIEKSYDIIEILKKESDIQNSKELIELVNSLKEEINEAKSENSIISDRLDAKQKEKDDLESKLRDTEENIKKVNSEIEELKKENKSASKSVIIGSYKELNTASLKCKTKTIIYFKEISYVRYTNSLISIMMDLLREQFNCKLLIYDNRVGLQTTYKGIRTLTLSEYEADKTNILKNSYKYVVTEPSQAFLSDIITSSLPEFDILIVYDRLAQPADIIVGNNVLKAYVINSKHDYDCAKNVLNITDKSLIISSDKIEDLDNKIEVPTLVIPKIEGYESLSESAKSNRYYKSMSKDTDSIMQTIFKRAYISLKNRKAGSNGQ